MKIMWAAAISLATLWSQTGGANAGGGYLQLPPILQGYHGKLDTNSKTGGLVDETLENYVTTDKFFNSRGTWYDITKWAARSNTCDKVPSSVACMACAMNMPRFTNESGVVPIAVANELFGTPEKGATCSMCLRIYMPLNYTDCGKNSNGRDPYCQGKGLYPYYKNIEQPWAWSGKIMYDNETSLYYFTALIIEWFDRAQLLPYQLTMPTQGKGPTGNFGDWPIKYKGVPCPVGKRGIEIQFLDFSRPTPANSSICNNQFGVPCGGSKVSSPGEPLGYLKVLLASTRIPISGMEYYVDGKWQTMGRSGDGFWQPGKGVSYSTLNPNNALPLKIFCTDGSKPLTTTVVPAKMLCSYQDPYCLGVEQVGLQC